MTASELKPNKILTAPIFPEPVQVIVSIPFGDAVKLIAKGVNSLLVYEPILTPDQLAALQTSPDTEPFDGDPQRFRLAAEAMRLALAFEYDPFFSSPSPALTRWRTSLSGLSVFHGAAAHPLPACGRPEK